jgi:hypothetical protein
MIPEITRRSSTRRAPGWFLGKCGSIAAHWASESQNRWAIHASNLPIEGYESDLQPTINILIEFGA